MKASVTANELFERGLINKAQAEEIQRYLKARERFLGNFGPGPGLGGNLRDLQKIAEEFRDLSRRIREDLRHHVAFLRETANHELKTLFGEDVGKDKTLLDTLDLIDKQYNYLSNALKSTCSDEVIDIIREYIETERKINIIMNEYSERLIKEGCNLKQSPHHLNT